MTLGLAGTRMPAFDYLTHQQRFALAHFVVSLARRVTKQTSSTTLAALDKEFSSVSRGQRAERDSGGDRDRPNVGGSGDIGRR